MRDGCHAHAVHGQGCERRAHATGAVENEFLARREFVAVIRAVGIHPEFQHAARRMGRAGNGAVAPQFTNVADVDQLHIGVILHRHHLLDRHRFDFALGLGAQLLDALADHVSP